MTVETFLENASRRFDGVTLETETTSVYSTEELGEVTLYKVYYANEIIHAFITNEVTGNEIAASDYLHAMNLIKRIKEKNDF